MTNDDVLDYLRKHLVILGEYIIQYNGVKEDTINGKTESWTIIRKIPISFEGDDKNERSK